jgi:hypothetical protein
MIGGRQYRGVLSRNLQLLCLPTCRALDGSSCNVRGPAGSRMWDPRSFRFRTFFAIALAAVLTAALLRHTLHVYGGISPEEIRWDALIAVLTAVVAAIVTGKLWRQ